MESATRQALSKLVLRFGPNSLLNPQGAYWLPYLEWQHMSFSQVLVIKIDKSRVLCLNIGRTAEPVPSIFRYSLSPELVLILYSKQLSASNERQTLYSFSDDRNRSCIGISGNGGSIAEISYTGDFGTVAFGH